MHGIMGRPSGAAENEGVAPSRLTLLLLVVMTGAAPMSLYMVGIACSQLIMGPLSDRFGRRPVLLAGLGLMVVASLGCSLAETLPQLIAARFFQALGGATGMVVSRAIIRDLYSRERVG